MSLSILTLTMITKQQSLEGSSGEFRPRGTDICFYEGEVEKILHARMSLAGKEKRLARHAGCARCDATDSAELGEARTRSRTSIQGLEGIAGAVVEVHRKRTSCELDGQSE